MPRPRQSVAQARASGALYKNSKRYENRAEPLVSEPLGDPPGWMPAEAADAWLDLSHRLPWLNRSHRGITEIASILVARMAAGTLGVPGMNLLRIVLGQMGATPATSRFAVTPEPEDEDPAAEFFR
ncbi:hypothetical protein IE4771_CH01946 [Rhizobium etli bv. mimosae str. IE4771]|uniref:Uncharacterized protein n=1 Tax=Rhizobium etli bv. mimosae str. IE4771 TaxID=1432050 RepID=A0A060HVT6_RHIET|nr:hypothetical protein IE4771_CH01946 [Rhizobium sp. IE4771]